MNWKRIFMNPIPWQLASDGDGVVCPKCKADFCTMTNETERFHFCPACGRPMTNLMR